MSDFDERVAEAALVPVEGWDLSWFAGRAMEERPPWGCATMTSDRIEADGAYATRFPFEARRPR